MQTSQLSVEDIYPLTPFQTGLLVESLANPDAALYVEQLHCRVRGASLNEKAFEEAWQLLVARHPALRTGFVSADLSTPHQVVFREVRLPIRFLDWSGWCAEEQEAALAELLSGGRRLGFTLERPPLMRVELVRLSTDSWRLVWTFHHIVLDGWSLGLLFRELLAAYEAISTGNTPRLGPAVPFRGYLEWLGEQDAAGTRQWWERALAGVPQAPRATAERQASAVPGEPSIERSLRLAPHRSAALRDALARLHVTLGASVYAAWALLLAHRTGHDDIVFGLMVSSRPPELPGADSMVGLMVNTLPLRLRLQGTPAGRELIAGIQTLAMEAQSLPPVSLAELARWSNQRGRSAPFESVVVIENYPLDKLGEAAGPLAIDDLRVAERSEVPLVLAVVPGEEIELRLASPPGVYSADRLDATLAELATLLEGLLHEPDRAVRIPHGSSASVLDSPEAALNASAFDRFRTQAGRFPEKAAIIASSGVWSYARVAECSQRVAAALSKIQDPSPVGVLMEQEPALAGAFLGALRTGRPYIPLDPMNPPARLGRMAAQAGVRCVLTDAQYAEMARRIMPAEGEVLRIEDLPNAAPELGPAPEDPLAYILYTSGSTGQPKGVAQSQRNLLYHIRAYTHALGLRPEDRLSLLSSYGFDAAVMDLYGALLNGATLLMASLRNLHPSSLLGWLGDRGVTVLHATPTVFRILAEQGRFPDTVRLVVLGGEAVYRRDVELFRRVTQRDCVFVNGFGPSESTLATQHFVRHDDPLPAGTVPIGKPVAGTEIVLLGNDGSETADGSGEIGILSPYVAMGYYGQEELTRHRFQSRPGDSRRLYRTGDLGRRLEDGSFAFLGRADDQVKVAGIRLELEEIRLALLAHPDVRDAAVLAHAGAGGDQRLTAYVVSLAGQVLNESSLRERLREDLPDALVPEIAIVDSLPLTPGGKVDRAALACISHKPPADVAQALLPAASRLFSTPVRRTDTVSKRNVGMSADAAGTSACATSLHPSTCEKYGLASQPNAKAPAAEPASAAGPDALTATVTDVWATVLGRKPATSQANFFSSGGHSLDALRLLSRLKSATGIGVPLRRFFECPTVAGIVELLAHPEAAGGTLESNPIARLPRPWASANHRADTIHRGPGLDFSLFFFAAEASQGGNQPYRLLLEAARFADQNDFQAVWMPERHFHPFGGPYPNPAVLAAALAVQTSRIRLRAGSVVLPLHDPLRVAEEWAMVDRLSGGRVDLSFASGWHATDFALAPERYRDRREWLWRQIDLFRQLWSGESIPARNGHGEPESVGTFPRPIQRELTLWLTCQSEESFRRAGQAGYRLLTNLNYKNEDDLAARIEIYRRASLESGHGEGYVTLMIHTFIDSDAARARGIAAAAYRRYVEANLTLQRTQASGADRDIRVDAEDRDALVGRAVAQLVENGGLIGDQAVCHARLEQLRARGVDEVACLIDFGIETETALAGLQGIDRLRRLFLRTPALPMAASESSCTMPASPGQAQFWFLEQLQPGTSLYNVPTLLWLDGPLDAAALRQAFETVAARQEALRTGLLFQDGEVVQRVFESVATPFEVLTVPDDGADTREQRAIGLATEYVRRPFDLEHAPLFRAALFPLAAERHLLAIAMHHAIGDGLSSGVLIAEVGEVYRAQLAAERPRLPELPVQFGDYAAWLRGRLRSGELDVQLQYYRRRLNPLPPELPLAGVGPRSGFRPNAAHALELPPALVRDLKQAALEDGDTPFSLLSAAYAALIHRLTRADDFVIGLHHANRGREELRNVIGYFVNLLPMRVDLRGAVTLADVVERVRKEVRETMARHEVPFYRIVQEIGGASARGRTPLVNAALVYNNLGASRTPQGTGLEWRRIEVQHQLARFDLTLVATEREQDLLCRWEGDASFLTPSWAASATAGLRRLLESMLCNRQENLDSGELPPSGQTRAAERRARLADILAGGTRAAAESNDG